jgi:hypothetical protein
LVPLKREAEMTRRRSVSGSVTKMVAVASLVAGSACTSSHSYHHRDRTRVTDSQGDVVNEHREDEGRYAHKAPPADRPETPPPQPGAQYVWVPGHYSWDGNDFQWHSGEWTAPPTGYRSWAPGHWQQTGSNNWVYVEGQWR